MFLFAEKRQPCISHWLPTGQPRKRSVLRTVCPDVLFCLLLLSQSLRLESGHLTQPGCIPPIAPWGPSEPPSLTGGPGNRTPDLPEVGLPAQKWGAWSLLQTWPWPNFTLSLLTTVRRRETLFSPRLMP